METVINGLLTDFEKGGLGDLPGRFPTDSEAVEMGFDSVVEASKICQ